MASSHRYLWCTLYTIYRSVHPPFLLTASDHTGKINDLSQSLSHSFSLILHSHEPTYTHSHEHTHTKKPHTHARAHTHEHTHSQTHSHTHTHTDTHRHTHTHRHTPHLPFVCPPLLFMIALNFYLEADREEASKDRSKLDRSFGHGLLFFRTLLSKFIFFCRINQDWVGIDPCMAVS